MIWKNTTFRLLITTICLAKPGAGWPPAIYSIYVSRTSFLLERHVAPTYKYHINDFPQNMVTFLTLTVIS